MFGMNVNEKFEFATFRKSTKSEIIYKLVSYASYIEKINATQKRGIKAKVKVKVN